MKSNNWSEAGLRMHESAAELVFDDGKLAGLKISQEIPDYFLDETAAIRDFQDNHTLGNFALAARVPEAVVNQWMREGFNIFDKNIGVGEIVARLERLEMDKLIATSKRLH